MFHEGCRLAALLHHGGGSHRRHRCGRGNLETGGAQYDRSMSNRVGKKAVIVGQCQEPLLECRPDLPEGLCQIGRRISIGFRHDDIDADGRRLVPVDPIDEFRHFYARPRPLAHQLQAGLVDTDDGYRCGDAFPGQPDLIAIEEKQAHALERRLFRETKKKGKYNQDERSHGAAAAGAE
ncbi:MAG: hypothetical protein A4E69_01677 [Syntrophus sp. PtaB.Bin138]|nr:MAG: hypothetical protein A4E69_01677 [Syntrophus sp. PtaB.Bin138]